MATIGKLVCEVEIKSDINLVYEIYKHKQNNCPVISPDKHFIHVETTKNMVEEVVDELHKIVFKVIEGGVLEVYNPLILTVNIEDMGHNKLVIWTMELKKVNVNILDPTPYLDLLCVVVGDMDAYFLKWP
ncbi:unnamed protein product [Lactuca saligna]|uniref:Bet v I/Major latex protein domain-containing protein n=1 Tax=Lactuca saligna TaxID=75948 RepID=A0AA36DY87_LACSI|nr:unnamed protein product [Lactuca saligna]